MSHLILFLHLLPLFSSSTEKGEYLFYECPAVYQSSTDNSAYFSRIFFREYYGCDDRYKSRDLFKLYLEEHHENVTFDGRNGIITRGRYTNRQDAEQALSERIVEEKREEHGTVRTNFSFTCE